MYIAPEDCDNGIVQTITVRRACFFAIAVHLNDIK